jgi:hypothetical protein
MTNISEEFAASIFRTEEGVNSFTQVWRQQVPQKWYYQATEHPIPEDHRHHDYFLNYRHAVKY